jgi:AraC-like DNA-binding protein
MPVLLDMTEAEKELLKNKPEFSYMDLSLDELNPKLKSAVYLKTENSPGFDQKTGCTRVRIVHEYEILLFTGDGGRTIIDQTEYQIHKGDIRILKPGQMVYSYRYKDVYVIYMTLTPDGGSDVIVHNNYIDMLPQMMPSQNLQQYISIFSDIIRASITSSLKNDLFIKYKLTELLYMIYTDACAADSYRMIGRSAASIIDSARSFMTTHFSQSISLADISGSVGLHPNYFHRLFKKCCGMTPLEFLTKTRLDHARSLLVSTDKSIAQIAEECGFDSASYFIVVFRKFCSVTPNEYRNMQRDNFWRNM